MGRDVIDGGPLYGNEFTAMQRAALGDYVVDGLGLSIQSGSGMTLDVAAGTYRIDEVEYEAGATFDVFDDGGAADRLDTISIDSNGFLTITKGVTEKVAEPIPPGETFLGLAYVAAGATFITDADLIDGRVNSDLVPPGLASYDATVTLGRTENQDVLFLNNSANVELDSSRVDDGFTCTIVNDDGSTITFQSTAGDTIRSESSLTDLIVQYTNAVVVWNETNNAWYLFGALS